MKKLFLIVLLPFLILSCGTKHYVLNSHFNPRPTSEFKFSIDKKKSATDINSVIDTNAIYLTTNYRRKKPEITGIYYRFLPNGVVYEVALYGESIENSVKDTTLGNYGKYRIVNSNRIRMEFMIKLNQPGMEKPLVYRKFQDAKIKGGNLYLVPHQYSKTKGLYKVAEGFGRVGAAYLAIFLSPVIVTEVIIPDKKVCFYRVSMSNLEYYLAKH